MLCKDKQITFSKHHSLRNQNNFATAYLKTHTSWLGNVFVDKSNSKRNDSSYHG